jgi:methionyl aminopeptidase
MRNGKDHKGHIDIGQIIQLHNDEWLANQRIAGKVAAKAIDLLVDLAKHGSLSLLEMDEQAGQLIRDHGCVETFYGYKGFPSFCCHSVNKQLVHGIATNYHLQDGDLYTCDLGATYKKSIADTATTVIVGEGTEEHKRLVQATKEALRLAIDAVQVGKQLGVIGDAIWKHSVKTGHACVLTYGGHFVGIAPDGTPAPHMPPFVANKANPNDGIRLVAGMAICIEPLFVIGSNTQTRVDKDGWTVYTDGGISSHEEHSIFISEDGVEVITARKGENNV